jgi:hypothetical protein
MKIIVAGRCNGMNEASTEEMEVEDDATEEDLIELAREHALQVTGFEFWYKKVEDTDE